METNTSSHREDEDALHRANLLLEVGKFDRALQEIARALTLQPEGDEAHLLAARAYLEKHRYAQARASALEAVRLAPEWPGAYYLLAIACCNLRLLREGDNAIARALELAPQVAEYHRIRAILQVNRRQLRQVLSTVETALRLDLESVDALKLRAAVLRLLERHLEAARSTVQALERDPENAEAWYLRGVQLLGEGRPHAARYALRQALAIDPEMKEAQEELVYATGACHPLWKYLVARSTPRGRIPLNNMVWMTVMLGPICSTWLFSSNTNPRHWFIAIAGLAMALYFASQILLHLAVRKGWFGFARLTMDAVEWEEQHRRMLDLNDLFDEGQTLAEHGDYTGARRAYLQALRQTPDDWEIQDALVDVIAKGHRLRGL